MQKLAFAGVLATVAMASTAQQVSAAEIVKVTITGEYYKPNPYPELDALHFFGFSYLVNTKSIERWDDPVYWAYPNREKGLIYASYGSLHSQYLSEEGDGDISSIWRSPLRI
jgi:hypothetical protein